MRPHARLGLAAAAVLPLVIAVGASPSSVRAQTQAPLAERQLDVDGDGVLDLVRVDNPSAVTVLLTRPAGQAPQQIWRPFAAAQGTPMSGTIAVGSGKRFGNRTVIVASVAFAGRRSRGPVRGRAARTGQTMVLAWSKAQNNIEILWEGAVGAQGRDSDYQVRVAASPLGLMRYQERADIRRCDNQPAYLFPEGFDYRRKQFRNISTPPRIPAGARVITASRQPPAQAPTGPAAAFRTQSASTQTYANHAGDLAPPRELDDGDVATVWRENTGGSGRGAFITLTSPMTAPEIAAVRIVPGDGSSKQAFARANRLRRIGLLIDASSAFIIEFPADPARAGDHRAPYWAVLPPGVRGRCITVVLDEVHPGRSARGRRSGDTAISDLAVFTSLDMQQGGPDAVLIQRVLAGGGDGDSAARVLAGRGQAAAQAVVAALSKGQINDGAALRMRRVLARNGDPAGVQQLVAGLAVTPLSTGDRSSFTSAVVALGPLSVPPLGALLGATDTTVSGRMAAIGALVAIADRRAQEQLIAAAGRGDREVRKAIAVGLGQREVGELGALVAAAEQAAQGQERGREADLWRATGLLMRRAQGPAQRSATRALVARLARVSNYEVAYRTLHAGASLADADAVRAVAAALTGLRQLPIAKQRALQRVVASAWAQNAHPDVRAQLVQMADSDDPGVRALAIAGIGPRTDADAASDGVLSAHLASDAWPRVRRTAANALGHRCGQAADPRTALWQAVDDDESVDVQRDALSALVACRAPRVGERLIAIAGAKKRPLKLRQRALILVPKLADPSLSGPLIALFKRLRGDAWSSTEAVRLAAGAAAAMGRLGTQDVVKPLLRAAREPSFPEVQAGAITGLGEMCPRAALPLFAGLVGSEQRAVAVAARAAYNRCRSRRRQ